MGTQRKPQDSETTAAQQPRRMPRRDALKGLSALALAAAGCSSSNSTEATSTAASAAGRGGSVQGSGSMVTEPEVAGTQPVMPVDAGSTSTSTVTAGTTGTASSPGSAGAMASSGSAGAPVAGAPLSGSSAGADAAGAAAMGGAGGGAAGTAGAAGAGVPDIGALQCIVTPAMTEGPFFVDEKLNRSNLVMGETDEAIAKAVPLHLVIGVFAVESGMCRALPGVQVDIWHANAVGVYSDVASGFVQSVDTRGKDFLRGYQITDEAGLVSFDTIYPGWYMSRTIHIHFKLRMLGSGGTASEFTSQMFFDESLNAMVLAEPAYTNRTGTRSVFNQDDHIFNGTAANGQKPPAGTKAPGESIMPVTVASANGYNAELKVGVMI